MKPNNDREMNDWEDEENTISLAEIARTISDYRRAIVLGIAFVVLAWMLGSALLLLKSPTRRVAELPFRLEFKGAERGQYPNGTRFQSSEILSGPVLLAVYRANDLAQFMRFEEFRSSLFILEQNEALEQIVREYRSRLADPKLTAVDRERLEQEFAEKRASLSQASYSLVFSSTIKTPAVPQTLQAKVLNDILSTWAEQTVQNKGVVLYDLSILSSAVFERAMLESYDYVITLDMLRSKINRVIGNIDELLEIPGAKVVRTQGAQRVSLAEIKVKLQDMLSFRIQPLVGLVLSKGISKDPTASIQFLETRLRFNELQRNEEERRTQALRDSLTAYLQQASRATSAPETASGNVPQGSGTTVIPQFGESFLDRIMEMSTEGNDLEYRQGMVDALREQSLAVVPLESEAEYYRQLLESLRGFESRARPPQDSEIELIRTQVDSVVNGAIQATDQVNQIYTEVSKNLNPSTVLFSYTAPPSFSMERSVALSRVLLVGLLLVLVSIPLAIAAALIHARVTGRLLPQEPVVESAEVSRPPSSVAADSRDIGS